MADYKQAALWKTAFGDKGDGLDPKRGELVGAYDRFRDRVALLLAQIQRELPDLTLHDITHVDALWRVASEIAGPDFPLNPAEALVLGGAFLLHDAAHCRAAFPGGVEELSQTVEWHDAAAQRKLVAGQMMEGSPGFQAVLFDTLRVLHPKQARKLAFAKWSDGVGDLLHLFPHDELREAYGHIIGQIAESHWYSPHELEVFAAKTVSAPVCLAPAAWTINPLKIAILLRVADAAHIDAKRAPRFLLAMNRPSGVSQEHWRFQARLHQPHCDTARTELVFSGSSFPVTEQGAWWLAYDAACLADKELSAADHLLRDHALPRLAAREVAGVRSPESFARNVPTEDWHPVDASLRISDIQSVVERFGGAKLYGDEPHLALRELLQNARDAVVASRALGALEKTEGSITVHLEEKEGEDWLHVTDTGIGMSRYVLVNVLLDFGRSLWRDTALRREWPGLAATGFDAVGSFGIGFFSVFMLGTHVKVTTHRQTCGTEDQNEQWVLELVKGIDGRPSLRAPLHGEALKRHGTRVSVRLLDKTKLLKVKKTSLDIFSGLSNTKEAPLTLTQVVGALAPALEVDVFTKEANGEVVKTVVAGDWRELEPLRLIDRIAPGRVALYSQWLSNDLGVAISNLSPMTGSQGEMKGRCAIVEHSDSLFGLQAGIVTVGGLYGGTIHGFAGIMVGKQADLLNRSEAIPLVEQDALSKWADNQANLLRAANKLTWQKSAKLLALGAGHDELLVITHGTEDWTANRLAHELKNLDEIWLLEHRECQYESDTDEVTKSDFERNLDLDPKVFVLKSGTAQNEFIRSTHWPSQLFMDRLTQPAQVFEKIANDVWPDCDLTNAEAQVIAHVSGVPIYRDVKIIYRTKHPAETADDSSNPNSN
ncbi:ATP-binding protein [Paucibacter sp. TC2R-5]|uniref:HD domain-containing protein n=1 Tax=Paucibacter sp. TC2R-5 TaxID=2893555 RepID=UPI0021E4A711|nr:ATP-binding protein [Paucibacter sp. TC2R-5]MCV2361708.1 ATP-binding protein [Paucibacter sp. TC2R-5]